ncbi:MAG: AraC family transcriptional regulator ligand-binding domain-containing protein [Polyangiaceae bacterium]
MSRPRSTLPASYARELVSIAARFEVPPRELLSGLGLEEEALARPDARVVLDDFQRLVRRAERLTGEPGLAYHAALHTRVSWHGFLGFAAMTASTIGEALELTERFAQTRADAVAISTRREADGVHVVLVEREPLGELREFFVTALFLGLAVIGESLAGHPLTGRVAFTHAEPSYFQRFLKTFPPLAAVSFEQPENRIVIPESVLSIPVLSADASATLLAREQCERELAALGEGARIVARLRAAFAREGFVALPAAARSLGVSERSLKRRLFEQNTSFSRVQEDARRARAFVLLEDPRLGLDEIAERLGYSDAANFTRAFKRWTGQTPGSVRNGGRP